MLDDKDFGFVGRIFCLIFIIVAFYGCEEPDIPGLETIVKGRVTDYYSHNGIKDIPILIMNEDTHPIPFGDNKTFIDTIITDSAGYFYYKFVNDSLRSYRIKINSTQDYSIDEAIDGSWINEGSINTFNMVYKPFRQLNLHVVNMQKKWTNLDIQNYMPSIPYMQRFSFSGTAIDTSILLKVIPDKVNGIYTDLYKVADPDHKIWGSFVFTIIGNKDTTMLYEY